MLEPLHCGIKFAVSFNMSLTLKASPDHGQNYNAAMSTGDPHFEMKKIQLSNKTRGMLVKHDKSSWITDNPDMIWHLSNRSQ